MSVPSLADVRVGLPPRVRGWVDSILEGVPGPEYARSIGVHDGSLQAYAAFVAAVAGLPLNGRSNSIREAVLRMRIRELEERE